MGRNEKMPAAAGTQKTSWVIPPVDERMEPLARVAEDLAAGGAGSAQSRDHRGRRGQHLPAAQADRADPAGPDAGDRAGRRARCGEAIEKKEKITIYGDYDVDGITGVSILWELLTLLGAQVDYYIPHRIDEGYGLNGEAVRSLAEAGTRLLITVDCGIGGARGRRPGPASSAWT